AGAVRIARGVRQGARGDGDDARADPEIRAGRPADTDLHQPAVRNDSRSRRARGVDPGVGGRAAPARADHRAVPSCATEILIQSMPAASGRASAPAPTSVGRCAYANSSVTRFTPARQAPAGRVHSIVCQAPETTPGVAPAADASVGRHEWPFASNVSVCAGAFG